MKRVLILALLLAAPAWSNTLSMQARHDHVVGSCSGTLAIGEQEIRYASEKHNASWHYGEIQELRLQDGGGVRVLSYQDQTKWLGGGDRAFNFHVEGSLNEAVEMLMPRLDQRLVIGFAYTPSRILAEFPVKHQRPLGGDDGTLYFGESTVVFRSSRPGESRTWRYSDIESISTSGPFQLTVSTYEQQKFHYANARAFNFQLKRRLDEEIYNTLWRRLNRPPDSKAGVLEKLRADIEQRAELAPLEIQIPEPAPQAPAIPHSPFPIPHFSAVEQILAEEGLPASFIGIAKVESGLNPLALSPKNARGMWQFIPATARRYGLRVDGRVDERTDPEKSTRAAAHYLKDLYGMFGDWKLAFAGYNAGEGRVQTALARARGGGFAGVAPLLPKETRNYVPSVMAAVQGALNGAAATWKSAAGRGYRVFAPAVLTN